MAAPLRCAVRRRVLGGIQWTPTVAAEVGQRRLSPSFVHNGRRFSSHQLGEGDPPLTFEEKVALWKRAGHLLFRTTNVVSMFVASYYILKVSVNELREPGYMAHEATTLFKKTEDKLRSLLDR